MTDQPLKPVGLKSQAVNFRILPPLSLYIHIPWCLSKCPYCDFNSHEARSAVPEEAYVAALIRDIELALPQIWGRPIYTVFIGGGTPSLLSSEAIEKILNAVRTLLPLDLNAEITLEANPCTVESKRFADYCSAGVNRLSLGIQSFNADHLMALGRIHNAAEALSAIEIAQQHFNNINLDLMYGLPNQTLEQAEQDILTALKFGPQHLSCYHLTIEPNTLFAHSPPQLPDDDTSHAMQQRIEQLLDEHGYLHYETSAFAQPRRQSRHNINYWQFGDYLGIGAGAHSKLSFPNKVIRQMRHKQPQAYLDAVTKKTPLQSQNELNRDDLVFEFMMNALRLNDGFEESLFEQRTSLPLLLLQRRLKEAEGRDLLSLNNQHIAPTNLGRRFLNDLLEIFMHSNAG